MDDKQIGELIGSIVVVLFLIYMGYRYQKKHEEALKVPMDKKIKHEFPKE